MAQISVTMSSADSLTIPFHLTIHAEARLGEEIWHGRASPSTRRKIQNRLNQRAHRRRLAEEKASKVQVFELMPPEEAQPVQYTSPESEPFMSSTSARASSDTTSKTSPLASVSAATATTSWCRTFEPILMRKGLTHPSPETETTRIFEESFLPNLSPSDLYRLPGDDHLLSLMYYNVFRALTTNVHLLNLNTTLMHTDTYPSPFHPNPVNFKLSSPTSLESVPPDLRPTKLQMSTPHHPCFDIFPCPVVRDNGIRGAGVLPHGTLCMTLAGRNTWNENERARRSGMVIWGPPEDIGSWEVTEGFVRSWGWLVRGSRGLERATNLWRGRRGERAMRFA